MTKNITFTLPAEAVEGATEAILLGDFNNWNPEKAPMLEKQKDGSYQTVVLLEEGKTYQYRFLLNDGRWVNDYNAQSYVNVEGLYVDNCVITVLEEIIKAPTKKMQATDQQDSVAAPVTNDPVSEDKKPVKSKAAKTAASKAKSAKPEDSKTKKLKSTSLKVGNKKEEKPAKRVKSVAPKAEKK